MTNFARAGWRIAPFGRWLLRGVRFGLGFFLIVGPWPAFDQSGTLRAWVGETEVRPDRLPIASSLEPFEVGVAEVDLTLPRPVPLAGFIGQIFQPYQGVNSTCAGKALTISTRSSTVTILGADLLLIDEKLARAVLTRTGLGPDQIYFTATHTHSGPGGWGNHPLERLVSGTFDPEVFGRLADRLAEVVQASRSRREPAEVAFVQTHPAGMQTNRIAPGEPTNDALSAWIFRSTAPGSKGRGLATFAVFGAHATIGHPVPPRLGGDYPSAFAEALRSQVDSGLVLFGAGTVGDASPVRPPAPTHRKSVEAYGKLLASSLARGFATAEFHREIHLTNLALAVELAPVQVPFFAKSLRFSPLFSWWVGKRTTRLHILELGPAILVGFPGDYAGHLGNRLRSSAPIVATSFNGDYKGYLVSGRTFRDHPCYETRWMSFFGPGAGDDLTNLSIRCVDQILANEHPPMMPDSALRRF